MIRLSHLATLCIVLYDYSLTHDLSHSHSSHPHSTCSDLWIHYEINLLSVKSCELTSSFHLWDSCYECWPVDITDGKKSNLRFWHDQKKITQNIPLQGGHWYFFQNPSTFQYISQTNISTFQSILTVSKFGEPQFQTLNQMSGTVSPPLPYPILNELLLKRKGSKQGVSI